MLWSDAIKALAAQTLVDGPDFEVKNFAAADLLSDILATSKEDFVILTGQTSPQAIRTAVAVGALGVIIVRGKQAHLESINAARNYGIPLAATQLKMFESCVTLGGLPWSSPSSKS
jgi:DNA-binding NarL/FixJ family response regulator